MGCRADMGRAVYREPLGCTIAARGQRCATRGHVEDWSALRRSLEPKYVVAQVLVVGIVFLLALMLGRAAFVFLAGGMIVASAFGLGLSAQGLFTARALARPNTTNGSVTFSTDIRISTHGAPRGWSSCRCLADRRGAGPSRRAGRCFVSRLDRERLSAESARTFTEAGLNTSGRDSTLVASSHGIIG